MTPKYWRAVTIKGFDIGSSVDYRERPRLHLIEKEEHMEDAAKVSNAF